MSTIAVNIETPSGSPITVGTDQPLLLIGGPCALESEDLARRIAEKMAGVCAKLGVNYVFKASFDKANRTSLSSYRGPGLEEGLKTLAKIRAELNVPVISDIHDTSQVAAAAEVLDIIQIPAFLCRQTDLLVAAAESNKPVNVKKGQFVSPWDMKNAVEKLKGAGGTKTMLVERGACFGYNNLVVDMRSLPVMRSLGCPVIFDATHSVQLPGGAGGASSGQREFIEPLTKAAVAAGIDGLFMEMHPDPDKALCDGPNSIPLDQVETLLARLVRIREAANS
ncbi:3-deoxy-8-phosphooctulonate synthase [Desulforhopalus sp. 52FAK]